MTAFLKFSLGKVTPPSGPVMSDKTGKFAAQEWHRLYSNFVPMRTGMLMRQVTFEPWTITHTVPYARRQYYGTNFNFSTEKHKLATARWDQVARRTQGERLAKAIEAWIARHGR